MRIMNCTVCEKPTEVLNDGVDYVICGECLKQMEKQEEGE